MSFGTRAWLRPALLAGSIVLCVAAGSVVWLIYHLSSSARVTSLARQVVTALPVPAARVGSRFVLYRDYLAQLDAAQRFLSGPTARAQGLPTELTPEMRSKVLDQAVRIAAVEELAAQAQIVITPLDVDRAFDELIAHAGTSTTPEEIHQFLQSEFGWDEVHFKKFVVRPALMEEALKQKKSADPQDATFDRELSARLTKPDVVRYVKM